MQSILNNINNIFKTTINNIYNETKIRNNKISIFDTLLYRFKYSELTKTKQQIVSEINFNNKNVIDRTSFYKKDNNIPLKYYKYIFTCIKKLYNEKIKDKNKMDIIAVDGTYINNNLFLDNTKNKTNKNTLETSLCMGYYNVDDNIPIDLSFRGSKNKNNEIRELKKWITSNKIKNITIVADRAYFSYELYNFLNLNNIKYVIRIKENSQLRGNIKKNNINKKLIEDLKTNNRVITYDISINKTIYDKNNKELIVECKNKYTLITNILDKNNYDDNKIKDIYNDRWKIEEYFKFIKNNFKISYLREKNITNNKKLIYCNLIITYFSSILDKIYMKKKTINKNKKDRNNKCKECTIKINKSNLVKGIYTSILENLIKSKLNVKNINIFMKTNIILIKNEIGRSYDRESRIPFTKWYVKKYHGKYKYTKIINSLKDNTQEELNKNLKTKSKKYSLVCETIDNCNIVQK
jgi:hypothetical protein